MEWLTEHDGLTGEEYIAVDTRGDALLSDPLTNKGTAFTEGERADLGLDGLVPPAVSTMDQQLARVYENYRRKPTPLERYIHLASLQDRNETLFFRLLHDHIDEMMPVVYTPGVGDACVLAHMVSPSALDQGAVYPELTRIRDCSHAVACAVIRRAVADGHASPGILANLDDTVRNAMWFPTYRPVRYRRAFSQMKP